MRDNIFLSCGLCCSESGRYVATFPRKIQPPSSRPLRSSKTIGPTSPRFKPEDQQINFNR
jgi:hypothetical protein